MNFLSSQELIHLSPLKWKRWVKCLFLNSTCLYLFALMWCSNKVNLTSINDKHCIKMQVQRFYSKHSYAKWSWSFFPILLWALPEKATKALLNKSVYDLFWFLVWEINFRKMNWQFVSFLNPDLKCLCLQITNLPAPYATNCTQRRLDMFSSKNSYVYSKSACLMQCRNAFVVRRCHCTLTEFHGRSTVGLSTHMRKEHESFGLRYAFEWNTC